MQYLRRDANGEWSCPPKSIAIHSIYWGYNSGLSYPRLLINRFKFCLPSTKERLHLTESYTYQEPDTFQRGNPKPNKSDKYIRYQL